MYVCAVKNMRGVRQFTNNIAQPPIFTKDDPEYIRNFIFNDIDENIIANT